MKCKKGKKHKWGRWQRRNPVIAMPVRHRTCKRCGRSQAQRLQKTGKWL